LEPQPGKKVAETGVVDFNHVALIEPVSRHVRGMGLRMVNPAQGCRLIVVRVPAREEHRTIVEERFGHEME
jgi:hypothetical protein